MQCVCSGNCSSETSAGCGGGSDPMLIEMESFNEENAEKRQAINGKHMNEQMVEKLRLSQDRVRLKSV